MTFWGFLGPRGNCLLEHHKIFQIRELFITLWGNRDPSDVIKMDQTLKVNISELGWS